MGWIRLLAWLAFAGFSQRRAFAEHSAPDALLGEQELGRILDRPDGRESRRPLTRLLLAMVSPATFRNAPAAAHGAFVMMSTKTDPASMRNKELKAELDELGVQWKGKVFDKDGLVSLLIEARKNPPAPSPPSPPSPPPPPPYDPDVVTGQTQKMPKQGRAGGTGGNPFGGSAGGANPFGGMGGNPFGGAPGGANPFGGGMGGNPFGGAPGGANPFGGMGGNPFGGAAGGANPFGGMGGMGGMQDMMQKVMSNPKAMALMQKAQSNPKLLQAMQEMQQNPAAAVAKYQSDPEVKEFLVEFQKIMGM